jgi:hypothetical protein
VSLKGVFFAHGHADGRARTLLSAAAARAPCHVVGNGSGLALGGIRRVDPVSELGAGRRDDERPAALLGHVLVGDVFTLVLAARHRLDGLLTELLGQIVARL